MPIAFPPKTRDPLFSDLRTLFRKPFYVVPAPSFSQPNLNLLVGKVVDVGTTSVVNPAAKGAVAWQSVRVLAQVNKTLSGVSEDATGAALGFCTVMIFRTEDRSLVAETVSDASGNWSVLMLKGGPFFTVEYKAGSPDVAGTSVNTLVPS